MTAASIRHNILSNEQHTRCFRTVREVMQFALPHSRRVSDKGRPEAPDAAITGTKTAEAFGTSFHK